MLVLRRKVGQRIWLKDRAGRTVAEIMPTKIMDSECSIGINAPADINITKEDSGDDRKANDI